MLGFLLTSLVLELTPGPNMGTLASLTLERGRSAGLAAVAGIALGLAIVGSLAAFGLRRLTVRPRKNSDPLSVGPEAMSAPCPASRHASYAR